MDRILEELDKRNLKGTFFCLGWIAERHPGVIRSIQKQGHHIGCHSYQHELSFRFNEKDFKKDTARAKSLIEDLIGEEVNAFRAPGFSITKNNTWALRCLGELGFEYDCSMFPAPHDYGGMPSYGMGVPKRIDLGFGGFIKAFPINIQAICGKYIVFSGGGFFRLFPYWLIDYWAKDCTYMMTYFHPRDFDTGQPIIRSLPVMRRFKSYVDIYRVDLLWQEMRCRLRTRRAGYKRNVFMQNVTASALWFGRKFHLSIVSVHRKVAMPNNNWWN